jgi:hypothetical protein
MRFREITEEKWWDNEPTIRLFHGTSSVFVGHIREHGLRPPKQDILEYALEVLEHYVPRAEWTDELLHNVKEHAARVEYGRVGDRGSVIYTFTRGEDVEGYATAYAQHGGEIAADVYTSACMFRSDPDISWREFKANPPFPPRFADAKPIVVEVEVPKSWCIFNRDPEEIKRNVESRWHLIQQRDPGVSMADFLDDIYKNTEVRISRVVPPEMIRSIRVI